MVGGVYHRCVVVSALISPVVLDGRVSDEKLNELLSLQAEYPELDYKQKIDLAVTGDLVELAKDVGAMQVRAGYVVVGVDNSGVPVADMNDIDTRAFDEASLVPRLLRYLPEPLELRTRVAERDGNTIVLIFIGRHPSGCAIFRADGQYEKDGELKTVFRAGDVFWRDGTRSVRITQQGFEEIIARRIADAKGGWLEEQQEVRQRDRAELEAAYASRGLATATLGSVNLDLDSDTLGLAALELVRADDSVALVHLLEDALTRARESIDRGEVETELADVLDKLTCLAATFLRYEQSEWFGRIVATLTQIYSLPLTPELARQYAYNTYINPEDAAPRVWLQIITRVYALGALAVRQEDWEAVRTLTLQQPTHLLDYDANWLRHALTMVSRAQHLREQQSNLLSLARAHIERLGCLRPDGLASDSDAGLTSVTQFDVLSNVAAIDGAGDVDARVFYSNFARFRQERIQPVVERLLRDDEMRSALFRRDDDDLAIALHQIGRMAREEGFRHDGFWGWERTPVADFIQAHHPETQSS